MTEADPQLVVNQAVALKLSEMAVAAKHKMLEAMLHAGLNLADCTVSVIVNFQPDRARVQPVPWYRGEPWPTKTELHQQAYALSAGGLESDYRRALLFTMDLPEPDVGITPPPTAP